MGTSLTPPVLAAALLAAALPACFPGGNDPPVWVGGPLPQCEDGEDNDLDGVADADDLGCQSPEDEDELRRTDFLILGESTCLAAPPCSGYADDDIWVFLDDRPLSPPEYEVLNDVDCPIGPRVLVEPALFVVGLPLSATYATAPGACP